jgi:flagellar basal-body rod modification protein FlgD
MIAQPVQPSSAGNKLPSTIKSSNFQLKSEDFIKMMITQLQNQDPLEPAKNDQLLAQMSQIGQLQASTSLQDSLKGLVLQNSLGSAGNLIGKMVQGLDDQADPVSGLVNSVRVKDNNVYLELDSGKTLELGKVTSISPAPNNASTGPSPTPATKPATK